MNKKILVAIPYHKQKNYCIKTCLKRAYELAVPEGYEIEVVMRFDLGEYGGTDNVKKQREFFRNLAINFNYDYLYFFGVDTIPPRDVLFRLVYLADTNDYPVVGGVYWGRHEASNGAPQTAVAWIHQLSQAEQTDIFSNMNTVVKVDGMGMDCVLIRTDILKQISFMSWVQNDDDYPFYDKVIDLGYDIYIDTNVQCKHYFDQKGYTYLAKVFK